MVPYMGPFVYRHLRGIEPGYLFLTSQVAMTVGALFAGWVYDVVHRFRSVLFAKIFLMGFSLWLLQRELPQFWVWFFYFWLYFAGGGVHPLVSSGYFQSGLPEAGFARARGFGTLSFFLVNFFLIFFPKDSVQIVRLAALFFFLVLPSVLFLPKVRVFKTKRFAGDGRIPWKKLFFSGHYFAFFGLCVWYNFQFITAETVLSEYISRLQIPLGDGRLNPLSFSWAIATFAETLFFLWASYQRGYSGLSFICMGFTAGLLRYSLLYFLENPWVELLVQGLHGIHFGAFYLGSVYYIKEKANPAFLATTTAFTQLLSRALGGGFGGFIFGQMGLISMDLVFLINGFFSFLGLGMLYLFKKHFSLRPYF